MFQNCVNLVLDLDGKQHSIIKVISVLQILGCMIRLITIQKYNLRINILKAQNILKVILILKETNAQTK